MAQINNRRPVQFKQTLTHSVTKNYRVTVSSGLINAIQLVWHDATSAFSWKIFTSCVESPTDDANLEDWYEETTLSTPAVAASAAGSHIVHLGNNGARHALVQIVTADDCLVSLYTHGKD